MCGQGGVKGVLKGKYALAESKKVLPLKRYKELIDEIAPERPIFYVWGGEPFMYPDFLDFSQYAVEKKITYSVNTNGTFLKRDAERIVRDRWHGLFVSLDGFEDVNDKIRGKGSYRRVVEGFEAINREKKRQQSDLPYMGIVTTINNMNYLYLDKLAEAAKGFGLSWHYINLGTYTNEAVVERHREFMRNHLDTEIYCLEAYNTGYNDGIDGDAFSRILDKVHALNPGYPIVTVPVIDPKKIGVYYSNLEIMVREKCPIPWCQVNIDYNGDVHFCADYPDYVLGNLKDGSFASIINNERAVRFRKALKDAPDGIFPGCLRCYQNMLFGKRVRGY